VPTVRFQVVSDLPPERILGALTDFSDRRPGWADVTEGNVLASERNGYQWNAATGEVTVSAVELERAARRCDRGAHHRGRQADPPLRHGEGARSHPLRAGLF
jgi:hypothetical protein